MGKKSRERRFKFMHTNLQKKARIHDLVLLNGIHPSNIGDLSQAVSIDLSNTLSMFDASIFAGELFSPPDFAVNIAPPFNNMFFEIHDMPISEDHAVTMKVGAWVKYIQDSEHLVASDNDKWIGVMRLWSLADNLFLGWKIEWHFWVNDKGQITGYNTIDIETQKDLDVDMHDKNNLIGLSIINAAIAVIFHGISLMNCKNITLVPGNEDEETSKQYQREFGIPLIKFKTLTVKPIGKQYEGEIVTKEYQEIMPLHLRRGNFATYSDDAPLFGKYTGTFWRPATTVGTEKRGIVLKDYKVKS